MKLDTAAMTVDLKSLSMGMNSACVAFPLESVDWHLEGILPTAGEGVLDIQIDLGERNIVCTGSLEADFNIQCARCLEPARFPVTAEISRVYSSDYRILEETDAVPITVEDGGLVILDALREAIDLSIPSKPLCSPDCPGISYN